eukprot:Opistho-2@94127
MARTLRVLCILLLVAMSCGVTSAQQYNLTIWTLSGANGEGYTSGTLSFKLYGSTTTAGPYNVPSGITNRTVSLTAPPAAPYVGTLLRIGIVPNADSWQPERITVTYGTESYDFKFSSVDVLVDTGASPKEVFVCAIPQAPENGAFSCPSTYASSGASRNYCSLRCDAGYFPSSTSQAACSSATGFTGFQGYSNRFAFCDPNCNPPISGECAYVNRASCRKPNVCGPCLNSYGVRSNPIASTSDSNIECTDFTTTYTIKLVMSYATGAGTDLPCTATLLGSTGKSDNSVLFNSVSILGNIQPLNPGSIYRATIYSTFFGFELLRGLRISCAYNGDNPGVTNWWLPSYIEIDSDNLGLPNAVRYNFLTSDRLDYGTWTLFAPPTDYPPRGSILCNSSMPGRACSVVCDSGYLPSTGVTLPSGTSAPFSTVGIARAACYPDCTARNSSYCAGLNRLPCGDVPNTCGACMPGYNTSTPSAPSSDDAPCVRYINYVIDIKTLSQPFKGSFYMTINGNAGTTGEFVVTSGGVSANSVFSSVFYLKSVGTISAISFDVTDTAWFAWVDSWNGQYINIAYLDGDIARAFNATLPQTSLFAGTTQTACTLPASPVNGYFTCDSTLTTSTVGCVAKCNPTYVTTSLASRAFTCAPDGSYRDGSLVLLNVSQPFCQISNPCTILNATCGSNSICKNPTPAAMSCVCRNSSFYSPTSDGKNCQLINPCTLR